MQRRTVFLIAIIALVALAGAAALLLLWPTASSLLVAPTAEPYSSVATTGSTGSTVAATRDSAVASDPAASASNAAASASPQSAITDGVVFGFVTRAVPAAGGTAILTVDFAEIRPVDEGSPPGGPSELSNPTLEAVPLIAVESMMADISATGAGTMSLHLWLARRNSADEPGTTLVRTPYWIQLQNGRVTHLRLQQLP